MSDPLQTLLQGAAKPSLFPPNSRYAGIDTGTLNTVDGKTIVYLRRRVVPPPERFALLQEYAVIAGDRLDNLAANSWRPGGILANLRRERCDATEELTKIVGRTLRITLPEGIPATPNA